MITAAHCFGDRGTRASRFRVTMGHEKRKWREARRERYFQEFRVSEVIRKFSQQLVFYLLGFQFTKASIIVISKTTSQ